MMLLGFVPHPNLRALPGNSRVVKRWAAHRPAGYFTVMLNPTLMIETLLKLPFSAAISLVQLITGRSRLKLECGWTNHPNEDQVGNFIAFWIKIINPSGNSIFLERIEAKDSNGDAFFPMALEVKPGQEIKPQRNIVALIPCGHIINTTPQEISIVDATESYHKLKGRKLSKAVAELKEEVHRLEKLGLAVHPRRYNQ